MGCIVAGFDDWKNGGQINMKAKWIAVAVASVIIEGVVAGFGGYTLGDKAGQTRTADIRTNFLAARGAGTGQQGAGMPDQGAPGGIPGAPAGGQNGGPQFNAANMALGQARGVDGNTVQLSTATEALKVKIGDKTQIQKMGQGSLSDIQPGDRVSVQGARASDGSFTAQSIQIGGGPAGSGPTGGNPPPAPATPAVAPTGVTK
jgi:hypothetical protein